MRLHYNTVSPTLLRILKQLMDIEALHEFRLVGGTCLSLQRGHRRSIDIDLFADIEYGSMQLNRIKEDLAALFPFHKDLDCLDQRSLGYSLRLGYEQTSMVKVDLFYTDAFIFNPLVIDGIRLADEREIAAMKLLSIGNGSYRQKDYWDIRELLDSYSLGEMIQWCLQRHPYSIDETEILTALKNIDLVQESNEGIDTLRKLDYWELKREEIRDIVDQYIHDR